MLHHFECLGKLGLMEGERSKFSQSSNTESSLETISILVVDDDTTCLSIVAAILKRWKYEVVTVKHPIDALCTLRIKGRSFDLVVSDVHMPDMNGFELQKKIDEEFNLPVVLMSADDKEGVILKGIESGAAYFMVKPIAPDDLRDLWQYTTASKKKGKGIVSNESESAQGKSVKGSSESIESSLSADEDRHNRKDSKRKSTGNENGDEFEDDYVDFYTPKKTKVVWTNELHCRFLEAIRCLGDRAVPKKILQVMRVPGLTRENIASHLQKYRIFLNRVQKATQRIQSSSERSMADQTLLRSTFAINTPSLILDELRRQPIRSTSYRSAENVPIVNSSNLGSTPFSNHQPRRTNSFVPQSGQSSSLRNQGYGQSRLLCNQGSSLHGGTSSGLMSGTSTSMQMYQPLTQATPKSTLTNIGLPNYNAANTTYGILNNSSPMGLGCVEAPNSFAGTSGLMNFEIQNDYISPSTATSSSGSGRAKFYTFASMNIGNSNKNNSYAFDTNVLLQQPYEVGDHLTSIFLKEVNSQSPHQQENDEEILDWGSLLSASNMEENPVTMNQRSSEQAPVQQLLGETRVVSNLCSLGSQTYDYFPSFDPSPSQEQSPGGLFGSNVINSNQSNGLSPSERNDDDFLESILCNEPIGEGDNVVGKF